jgi:ribonuclease T2
VESQRPHSRHNHAASSAPGDFDFYLLNLSWSPEFCATHPSSPECATHPGFVVHGLWPQNTDGTYPENCSNAPGPTNPGAFTAVIPTVSLIEHEWTTHGTCSGLAADAYFNAIRSAFQSIRIPAPFTSTQPPPATLPPANILAEFAAANPGFPTASFALSCGNNYLTAIEVCMDKNLHPEACQSVRSCRANQVKITPR